jgi:hypothetical protein
MRKIIVPFLFICIASQVKAQPVSLSEQYIRNLKQVTDVMVNDVASPVAASRYYAYITLATYELQSLYAPQTYPSMKGKLNGFPGFQLASELLTDTDSELAVLLGIFKAAEKLLPSGYMFKRSADSLMQAYRSDKKADRPKTAVLVDSVVKQLMVYVRQDRFNKLNNMPRYVLLEGDGYWKPTPPVFMAPIEPHWNKVRTFFLDSAQQFRVKPPAPYDKRPTSSFYKQLYEVYAYGQKATKEEQEISNFWDCNPFAVQQIGHIEFGLKKISPGGHWVGIAGIACRNAGLPLHETVRVHTLLSLALADAFIACWDEKYRSNRVRPETAIRKLIDPRWKPLLQTPPFPEYVSGHSVASNAAAEVLTALLGDAVSYTDDTEVEFGLPVRKYTSFNQAAAEASVSRLYGGIHYRDAIDQGVWQGREVGRLMIRKLGVFFQSAKVTRP